MRDPTCRGKQNVLAEHALDMISVEETFPDTMMHVERRLVDLRPSKPTTKTRDTDVATENEVKDLFERLERQHALKNHEEGCEQRVFS